MSDCSEWNKTEFINYDTSKTESDVLTEEQEIERIVTGIQMDYFHEDSTASKKKLEQSPCYQNNINSHGKVTLLSPVKLTPENQAFYKVHNRVKLTRVDKDCYIFLTHTQNGNKDYKPKKKN